MHCWAVCYDNTWTTGYKSIITPHCQYLGWYTRTPPSGTMHPWALCMYTSQIPPWGVITTNTCSPTLPLSWQHSIFITNSNQPQVMTIYTYTRRMQCIVGSLYTVCIYCSHLSVPLIFAKLCVLIARLEIAVWHRL